MRKHVSDEEIRKEKRSDYRQGVIPGRTREVCAAMPGEEGERLLK